MPIYRRPDHEAKLTCTKIPDDLIMNRNLSARALGVAVYIIANAFGRIDIERIQDRFGLKDYTWRAISKELRDNNILELIQGNGGSQLIFKY